MRSPRVELHDLNVRFTRKRYHIIMDLGNPLFSRVISTFTLPYLIIKTSECIHIRLLRSDRNIIIFGIIIFAVPEKLGGRKVEMQCSGPGIRGFREAG